MLPAGRLPPCRGAGGSEATTAPRCPCRPQLSQACARGLCGSARTEASSDSAPAWPGWGPGGAIPGWRKLPCAPGRFGFRGSWAAGRGHFQPHMGGPQRDRPAPYQCRAGPRQSWDPSHAAGGRGTNARTPADRADILLLGQGWGIASPWGCGGGDSQAPDKGQKAAGSARNRRSAASAPTVLGQGVCPWQRGPWAAQILMKRMLVTRAKPPRSRRTLRILCSEELSSCGRISMKVM